MRYAICLALLGGLCLLVTLPTRAADDSGAWGTIKGQVVFGGAALPAPKPADVNKDQKHCLANGKIFFEDWVIDKESKGVKWVFVWLAPPAGGKKLPIHPSLKEPKEKQVTIDQPCCAFVPHAVALRQGQDLVVKNSAPVAHNVKWSGWPGFNESGNVLIPAGASHTITGLRQQRISIPIECNIHPWMKGYVRVFNHPYFALTGAKGTFQIEKAPAGDWQLVMWHESAGWVQGKDGTKITVKGGGATDVGKVPAKP